MSSNDTSTTENDSTATDVPTSNQSRTSAQGIDPAVWVSHDYDPDEGEVVATAHCEETALPLSEVIGRVN